jgi:hypothetical protein
MRTNRFLGLRVGTDVWRRLLISCCTTIAAPNSAHVLRMVGGGGRIRVQRGGIESNSKLATLPWVNKGSAHRGYSRPCSHVRHTQTDRIDRHGHDSQSNDKMPDNVVESPYPLVDADPHFSRVVRYMRASDYAVWAGATAAFPSALYFWGM